MKNFKSERFWLQMFIKRLINIPFRDDIKIRLKSKSTEKLWYLSKLKKKNRPSTSSRSQVTLFS